MRAVTTNELNQIAQRAEARGFGTSSGFGRIQQQLDPSGTHHVWGAIIDEKALESSSDNSNPPVKVLVTAYRSGDPTPEPVFVSCDLETYLGLKDAS